MSIENDLQTLTKAIEANSAAVLLLAAKLNAANNASTKTVAAVETVAEVEKKAAPVVEKKAAPVEVVEEELEELEEEVVESKVFTLPAGVRNEKFYEKHVLPVTSKLGQMDKDALIKLIKGVFKSPKGGREIDPTLWDSLVEQSQQAIDAMEKQQDDYLA